jgi:hypothetical protein
MHKLIVASFLCLGAAACATPQQSAGTAAGAVAGAVVAGPVGAAVGAGVGAVATAPRAGTVVVAPAPQMRAAPARRAVVRK